MIAHGQNRVGLSRKRRITRAVLLHLQPSLAQVHLHSIVLQFHFEIDGVGILRIQQQAPVVALPAGRIDLDVYFTRSFIDVSNKCVDEDGPRDAPKDNVPLGDPAEMDVVIEARMFDLLDHVRAR
jgi:hypothetical protein